MSGDRYTIRLAEASDLAALPGIEEAASRLFPPERLVGDMAVSEKEFARGLEAGLLWVLETGDVPVGFLLAEQEGQELHLVEMDVHPEHGAQGLGTLLLRKLMDYAREGSFAAITLSTFDDMRWNAPFYAKSGFETIDMAEQSSRMRNILAAEQEAGLTSRVAMRLNLGKS